MTEELTKEKALEICAELWDWLAENPTEDKEAWPGWDKYGAMRSECPCCEYDTIVTETGTCQKCPLLYFWPEEDCIGNKSPYTKWFNAKRPKTRIKYAKQIADGARMELAVDKEMINPKLINSNIVDCIPQSVPCPLNCPECYFNTYFKESFNDLPRLPNPKVVNEKELIVRVNSGHDSNIDKAEVLRATRDYKHKFYNTSLPKLNGFPGPVVFTINPRGMWHEILQEDYNLLMFVRVLVGPEELQSMSNIRQQILAIQKFVPVVITFMRYKKVPKYHGYIACYNIKHQWYQLTDDYKIFVMKQFKGTGVRMCGTLYSNLCVDCHNCEDLYWAWTRR